ncbi:hypothetical protein KJ903_01185 [Patescibacteria group bacterium]|nr:hypothetical protein [Patescibacteria group bacterium]
MKKSVAMMTLLALAMLVGCSCEPNSYEQWEKLIANKEFVKAYKFARKHLPLDSKMTFRKVIDYSRAEITGNYSRDLQCCDQVKRILDLENPAECRRLISEKINWLVQIGECTQSYDGLILAQLFTPGEVKKRVIAEKVYRKCLEAKSPYAAYVAKNFSLEPEKIRMGAGVYVEHLLDEGQVHKAAMFAKIFGYENEFLKDFKTGHRGAYAWTTTRVYSRRWQRLKVRKRYQAKIRQQQK